MKTARYLLTALSTSTLLACAQFQTPPTSATTLTTMDRKGSGDESENLCSSIPSNSKMQLQNEIAGQPILILGDSLTCGAFGYQLVKVLQASNPKSRIRILCSVSSMPDWWQDEDIASSERARPLMCLDLMPGQSLPSTMAEIPLCGNPSHMTSEYFQKVELGSRLSKSATRIIFAMGANTLPAMPNQVYSEMSAAVAHHPGSSCEWIGPPHSRIDVKEQNLDAFYQHLAEIFHRPGSACKLIDSRCASKNLDEAHLHDGLIQRTSIGAASWLQGILDEHANIVGSEPQ